MGFFSSLKRNSEIIKAETDVRDISEQMGVIRRDFDDDLPVERKTVQNTLDWVNKTHQILNDEMIHELENNAPYVRTMYPNLSSEIKLLEVYRAELKDILDTKFPEESA